MGPRHLAYPSIRSAERRRWSAELAGPDVAGLVLHGAGGIGKSALAAEIAARIRHLEPGRVTVVCSGEVSADAVLARLATALRRHPVATTRGGVRALAEAGRTDLSWGHRLDLLREHVLGEVPVLVVLDDFDDNLSDRSSGRTVEDRALAGLLADWAGAPRLGRLLITCRDQFALPGTAGEALGFRCVGPLSREGAVRLAASLPVLGLLGEADLGRAWRLCGGHPRTIEYLDAVLSTGEADFAEVAGRLAGEIQARTGETMLPVGPGSHAGLSPAAAAKASAVAGEVLLGDLCARLSAAAHDVLTGASVYREPVGAHVLLLPAGAPRKAAMLTGLVAECAAAGLLTVDYTGDPPSVFVHRWTARELHRRLARDRRGEEVADAHRRAAEYWRWRIAAWPQHSNALHEAGYHLLQAGDRGREGPGSRRATRTERWRAWMVGVAAVAVAVSAVVIADAAGAFPAHGSAPARPAASAGAVAGAPAGAAANSAGVRDRAASWAARQVSRDAIVACDPAMCAALQAQGIAPGNLLVLRPSATDPLGSDVVMATPAVRSQFGSRLVSVYAPEVIASFGAGGLRIDVRAVAPDGAAAYRTALAADLAERRGAGRQLLRNPLIEVSAAARADLAAGRVDGRLLLTLAAVAAVEPVRVTAFSDSGPRAGPGVPLRAAELTVPAHAAPRASTASNSGTAPRADSSPRAGPTPRAGAPLAALRKILAFVRAQRPPYRPIRAVIVHGAGGAPLLSVEFGAPSPTGMLQSQSLIRRGPG